MRLRVKRLSSGPGPGEVVVEVETAEGATEEVVVHSKGLHGDTIEVGYPIHRLNDRLLVELPRETVSGAWRVWVPAASVA